MLPLRPQPPCLAKVPNFGLLIFLMSSLIICVDPHTPYEHIIQKQSHQTVRFPPAKLNSCQATVVTTNNKNNKLGLSSAKQDCLA